MTIKRNSILSLVLAGVAGIAAGSLVPVFNATLAAAATRHAKTVEAERFVMVDGEGKPRVVMQVTGGDAVIAMYDGSGADRTELRVDAAGRAVLGFFDEAGRKRVAIGENVKGKSGVGIYGPNGKQAAGLAISPNGEVSLTLLDSNRGTARVGLGVAASGAPALALFDQNGKDRGEFYLSADGAPGLALADPNGKTVSGLPMTKQPAPPQASH